MRKQRPPWIVANGFLSDARKHDSPWVWLGIGLVLLGTSFKLPAAVSRIQVRYSAGAPGAGA
ncbi:MAG TPA: hypothetical protein VM677_31125 [Actinokineospora sp.]|nr:hypothetical protein [Actinokineospora sp.]